jgi:hypothetical protein
VTELVLNLRSPTKLELSEALIIEDIISPGFQAAGDATCYDYKNIKRLKSLRFPKHI